MSEVDFQTLSEVQQRSCEQFADKRVFGTKQAGAYQWITYAQFGTRVDHCRGGLAGLGVTKGDKVAIISDNRVEWAVAAYASYGLGAVFVPMYEKQLAKDWEYILSDCGAKLLIVPNEEIFNKTNGFPDKIETLEHIVQLGGKGDGSWAHLLADGKKKPADRAEVGADDLAGLIYTSGTTGNPKGVELTHGNFTANLRGMHQRFPFLPDDVSLSFLPWAHSFGQTCELHGLISMGGALGLAERVETLIENLGDVQPTLLFSVPRIFNKLYDAVSKQVSKGSKLKQGIFAAAMRAAAERRELERRGAKPGPWLSFKLSVFDRLAFSKVRARLGGRLRYAFSGGAALSPEVAEFIDSMNITVYEGYGLTETSPILTANCPGERKIGSVGRPFPEVTIVIDGADGKAGAEGEVLAAGPNIMRGYYNNPDATAEAIFEKDGVRFFRTGDLGKLDEDGYLYITGRVKELYKLENGKYVAPAPLEEQLRLSGFVNQAYIHGTNKPYNVALIVPDEAAVKEWASVQGLHASNFGDLCKDDRVVKMIQEEVESRAADFKGYERPKKLALIAQEFTPEDDLLTPTLKYKRRNIEKRYGDVISSLY